MIGPSLAAGYRQISSNQGQMLLADEPENRLAFGLKLDLNSASLFGLELIPGLGDKLAGDLIKKRDKIYQSSLALPEETRHRAFELAHGIGPKTSRKIEPYLEVVMPNGF